MAATRKSKPGPSRKRRVRAKVSQAASIREYHDAVLANLDEAYWDVASSVLDGNIPVEQYAPLVQRLLALKDAGAIVKATLIEVDEEERADIEEEERTNGKKGTKAR